MAAESATTTLILIHNETQREKIKSFFFAFRRKKRAQCVERKDEKFVGSAAVE